MKNIPDIPIPDTNSPAGRLYDVIRTLWSYHYTDFTVKDCLATMFIIDPKDTAEMLYVYARLIMLVRETRDSISEVPKLNDVLYLRTLDRIQQGLAEVSLGQPIKDLCLYISEDTLAALSTCVARLSAHKPEHFLRSDDLIILQRHLHEIAETITKSDLPQVLKFSILEHLDEIGRAIRLYRITGVGGLQYAADSGLGSIMRQGDLIKNASEKQRETVTQYMSFLGVLDQTMSMGSRFGQLIKPVAKFLHLLPPE